MHWSTKLMARSAVFIYRSCIWYPVLVFSKTNSILLKYNEHTQGLINAFVNAGQSLSFQGSVRKTTSCCRLLNSLHSSVGVLGDGSLYASRAATEDTGTGVMQMLRNVNTNIHSRILSQDKRTLEASTNMLSCSLIAMIDTHDGLQDHDNTLRPL